MTTRTGTAIGSNGVKVVWDRNARGETTKVKPYCQTAGTTLVSQTDLGYDDGGRLTTQVLKSGTGTTRVSYTNSYDDQGASLLRRRQGLDSLFRPQTGRPTLDS